MRREPISAKHSRRLTIKSFILPILVGISGCVPEPLDVDGIPVVTPQIVVSTQFIPNQSLVVLLTKTFGALDASEESDPLALLDQIAVNDATVTISGPTGNHILQALGNGLYGGLVIPFESGEEYELNVISESLGQVSAVTTVMPRLSFESIAAELYYTGFDDTLAQITYSINDPIGKNWYMLNVQQIEADELVENVLNPNAFMRLIEDDSFDGHTYGETFRVFPRDFSPGDTIAVFLSPVTKDYFDFMQLRLDNRFSFVEYLGEPINYPSNVKGGKGFFNLYVPDIRLFILE
jgi:Domain of unknown function (DUF4249)